MAKARLRRGIAIVKLANRIEALKMQEDDEDNPGEPDLPVDSKAAAGSALSGETAGTELSPSTSSGSETAPKKTLSNIAKGAIFREVVMAKVREAKDQEQALQVEKEANDKAAKRRSFQEGQ